MSNKSRVRIASAVNGSSRVIFVDDVVAGRCWPLDGVRSGEKTWAVRDAAGQPVRRLPFFTLADVRAYFDPTPV